MHTVGVRDSIEAINGIGHAAMMTHPGFRQALAQHGFTLDPSSGEVVELAEFVGPFSARAAQIGRHLDTYEAQWRAANPHAEPGPGLRRAWDRRAWADARPDKIVPRDGAELTSRWVDELHALGYRDQRRHRSRLTPRRSVTSTARARLREVLARLGSRRSGWNAADVRGEVEQLIARANIVTEPAVRLELAEDLTARAVADCVPLLDRPGVPEHVRALTSRHVLEVEADLVASPRASWIGTAGTRRCGRCGCRRRSRSDSAGGGAHARRRCRPGRRSRVRRVPVRPRPWPPRGPRSSSTVRRLRVVTPTLKAARVAARQVGGDTSSAAWLAHQHGFRWHDNGAWTRLQPGDIDPDTGVVYAGPRAGAVLAAGDVLLIDEAGMLDQDTARALLRIADEHCARVVLVGDRHQLPAVGRGGVLDLAARHVHPDAHRELDTVHRFTRTITTPDGRPATVPDEDYAQLSLAMRTADDPAAVFDALLARDQIRIHASDTDRVAALARARRPRPPARRRHRRGGGHQRASRRPQRRHPGRTRRGRTGRRHPHHHRPHRTHRCR